MNKSVVAEIEAPRFRSGVAARMAKMPASTLRIWERRYGVVNPTRSLAGQRLYSRRDVQRLVTLKTLSERGHAIGVIAPLNLRQLEQLAQESTIAFPTKRAPELVVAVGSSWNRPYTARNEHGHINRLWRLYADIAAAKQAPRQKPIDALLVRLSSLHTEAARDLLKLADRCGATTVVVAYSFSSQTALEILRIAGVRIYREMGRAVETGEILADIARAGAVTRDGHAGSWSRAKRRFNDAQLAAVAKASSTITCECPRHLSDLILQLSAFEDYSDNCAARNVDDAILHGYLGDIANSARQLFETALERLAEAEGLALDTTRANRK